MCGLLASRQICMDTVKIAKRLAIHTCTPEYVMTLTSSLVARFLWIVKSRMRSLFIQGGSTIRNRVRIRDSVDNFSRQRQVRQLKDPSAQTAISEFRTVSRRTAHPGSPPDDLPQSQLPKIQTSCTSHGRWGT